MNLKYDIVVFCHLRWSFVWQRPQHILSRLATDTRVFYIEEPVFDEAAPPSWRITEAGPNLFVCTPVTNVREGGFHPNQIPALQSLIDQLKSSQSLQDPVAWCYTPMAVPLLESLKPSLVVYDCMDELSAFLHAPPELLELENQLLQKAALVFTGGPSLYRAKCSRHPMSTASAVASTQHTSAKRRRRSRNRTTRPRCHIHGSVSSASSTNASTSTCRRG